MKVVEVVKPRMMRMMALGVNFMRSRFSPLTLTGRSYGGKGRKMRATPTTAMSIAQKMKMVEKGRASAATKPIAKGSRNCAMDMLSLVKMLAMVPFSLNISMQLGVMLTSRKPLAAPAIMPSM